MCAICPSPDAELIESGGEMLQKMIEGRWINLESVWQAETKAPKLGALWKLCAPFPSGTRVDLYAYVKASFDPEKTVCIDNVLVPFDNDKLFQQGLTRAQAVGLLKVSDQVEVGEAGIDQALVCTSLHAVKEGEFYTFFPRNGQSEVLKFKGTLDTQEKTLAGISKMNEQDACRSLAKRLTKFYGAKVIQMDPASVPYIVHPKETPSTADGLFVVDAGGTAYGSWSKMVFVLEAKLSVNVPKKGKKGKKRPRFLDQFAGYEKAIRAQEWAQDYTIIKVLATQTDMSDSMLKEDYMKDIEVLRRAGDKFEFTCNYLTVTEDSLTLPPTPS
jgi:hypothetical protein